MLSPTDALFTAAIGLAPPWYCKRSEFSADKSRLDLWLDFPAGSRFVCPTCSAAGLPVHDTARFHETKMTAGFLECINILIQAAKRKAKRG